MTRTAIVVLGMHRSGTSALAGVMSMLGAVLPNSQLKATEDNERGYFESSRVTVFQDDLLCEIGSSWDDPLPLPRDWTSGAQFEHYANDLADILVKDFGDAPLIVLKDPRSSRLVPLWEAALGRIHIQPLYVVAMRDPDEVAQSLAKRDQLPVDQAYLLWLRYTLEPILATQGTRRAFVTYGELLADWRKAMGSISRQLQYPWPRGLEDAAKEVDEFLSDTLRHNRHESVSKARPEWVDRAAKLVERASEGWNQELEREIDIFSAGVTAAVSVMGPDILSVVSRALRSKRKRPGVVRRIESWVLRRRRQLAPEGTAQDIAVRTAMWVLRAGRDKREP